MEILQALLFRLVCWRLFPISETFIENENRFFFSFLRASYNWALIRRVMMMTLALAPSGSSIIVSRRHQSTTQGTCQ